MKFLNVFITNLKQLNVRQCTDLPIPSLFSLLTKPPTLSLSHFLGFLVSFVFSYKNPFPHLLLLFSLLIHRLLSPPAIDHTAHHLFKRYNPFYIQSFIFA
ncbi:unnamed protein product [Lactuca virosa]|uniref:Uncharacterized protein n=1 Tax=Lactuca virosa TaxID=75947 RepID=A0AAU9M161_9ASTR|nr:unnamed protein product [Lactuca virosa]